MALDGICLISSSSFQTDNTWRLPAHLLLSKLVIYMRKGQTLLVREFNLFTASTGLSSPGKCCILIFLQSLGRSTQCKASAGQYVSATRTLLQDAVLIVSGIHCQGIASCMQTNGQAPQVPV